MNSIKDKIQRIVSHTIAHYQMIQENDRIIISVSGGADSMALLYLLKGLRPKLHLELLIAHVNHQIRGRESDKDEQFVKSMARKFDLAVVSKKINIPLLRKRHRSLSLEEIAHQERIKYFHELLQRHHFNKIALGHHLDDSIENYFLSTFNGGSLNSLSGIKPREGFLIRPLIRCLKSDLMKFVRSLGLSFRLDRTNWQNHYPRNWTRNVLIPFIERKYKPVKKNISQMMDILDQENEFMKKEKDKYFKQVLFHDDFYSCIVPENTLPLTGILRRLVKEILRTLDLNYNFYMIDMISQFMQGQATSLELNDLYIWRYGKRVFFTKKTYIKDYEYHLNLKEKSTKIRDLDLEVKISTLQGPVHKYEKNCLYLAKDKITRIIIRNKKISDYIILLNTDYRVKLKKLFIDLKVPDPLRKMVPIVEVKGQIAGIYFNLFPLHLNNKTNERFKILSKTRKIIKLEFKQTT